MRKNRIICFLLLVCLHITVFVFPISTKGEESFKIYSKEEISRSVGYISLSSNNEIKHLSSTYIAYQDEKYSYLVSSEVTTAVGYERKAHFGDNILDIELVGSEESLDLAVYRFKKEKYSAPALEFASSTNLHVGETIFFYGMVGFTNLEEPIYSYEYGNISKKDILYCPSGNYLYDCSSLMLVDLSLDYVSQGGPVFNKYGYIVGMITTNDPSSSQEESGTLYHSTFSNDINLFINRIIKKDTDRADLGLYIDQIENLSVDKKKIYNLSSYKRGTIVTAMKNAASMSGLGVNYSIVKINGTKVETTMDLIRELYKYDSGTVIRVTARKTNGNLKTYYIKA